MDFKKPKCQGDTCGKISQYDVGNSKLCVGCLKVDSRKHASHRRMEHQILSDITRGVRKSLPYTELFMKYDQVYHDEQRPDLMITNKNNSNIVMVEVDENPHFTIKHLREDDARFKAFYEKSTKKGQSLSVVRVVPGEKSKTSMFKTSGKSLYKNNGYIEKNPEHYNKYIKESVSKIARIIDDKQSYRYKDTQVSIGPTIKKKSHSPIFSDTSSPDVSITINRARAILKPDADPEESLSSQLKSLTIFDSSKAKNTKVKSISPPALPKKKSRELSEMESYIDRVRIFKLNSKNPKYSSMAPLDRPDWPGDRPDWPKMTTPSRNKSKK